jgi:Zn-finger nucleic acid-binding protein
MELKMKCPVCKDIDLVMSDRQGVEIDYCQSCRGVWLDRGELDKIIERSSMQNNSSSKPQYEQSHNKYDKHNQQGYHKKKKEGFLSEIFDFDF